MTVMLAHASDRGARTAATLLGITVHEYRAHEAIGERWCSRCRSWQPNWRVRGYGQAYCRICWNAYCVARQHIRCRRNGITDIFGAEG